LALEIVINSLHLQGSTDRENQTSNLQEQQLAITQIIASTPEKNSCDAIIDESLMIYLDIT
jgi:hypothetical protein